MGSEIDEDTGSESLAATGSVIRAQWFHVAAAQRGAFSAVKHPVISSCPAWSASRGPY